VNVGNNPEIVNTSKQLLRTNYIVEDGYDALVGVLRKNMLSSVEQLVK
jgi:hypothetical protein